MILRLYAAIRVDKVKDARVRGMRSLAVATAIVLGAAAIRYGLNPVLLHRAPYLIFMPAILIVALVTRGRWPSVWAVILSIFFGRWFVTGGSYDLYFKSLWDGAGPDWTEVFAFFMFVLTTVMIAVVGEMVHTAFERLQTALEKIDHLLAMVEHKVGNIGSIADAVLRHCEKDSDCTKITVAGLKRINELVKEGYRPAKGVMK